MTLVELQNALPTDFNFGDLVQEIGRADIPWARHYREYQSGDWWTCSLLGQSRHATSGEVMDIADPIVTGALERLPVTRKLLQDLGLQFMTVRLARLDPNGALWEHKDYQDLRPVPRYRIHLPIDTNQAAFLVSGGRRFNMAAGSLWMFRPTMAHGAINAGDRMRVHLMIDVYENDRLRQIQRQAVSSPASHLPEISAKDLMEMVGSLHTNSYKMNNLYGARPESLTEQECAVLRLYFAFAIREGALYDALEQTYLKQGDAGRAAFWASRRKLMLGNGIIEHD